MALEAVRHANVKGQGYATLQCFPAGNDEPQESAFERFQRENLAEIARVFGAASYSDVCQVFVYGLLLQTLSCVQSLNSHD